MKWLVLGFDYESVMERWEDARFAQALEHAWLKAGRPSGAEAYVSASSDEFAFRFWLNTDAAELLAATPAGWRERVLGEADAPPTNARPVLPPP